MSTKKLTASILLLVIGGLLITSGFVTNDYLRSEVSKGVPDALLGIKNQVEPEIEETVKVKGIPMVLLGIKGGALPEFEDNVESEAILEVLKTVKGMAIPEFDENIKTQAIPEVLAGIKTQFIPEIEKMVNFTTYLETLLGVKTEFLAMTPDIVNGLTAARIINQTIDFLYYFNFSDWTLAKEHYFNNYTIKANTTCPVMGVSEYIHSLYGFGNLSYTTAGQDYLLYGNALYGLPGLITDLELGTGLLEFMGYYALGAAGNLPIQDLMTLGYNATWLQITYLAGYIKNYLWTIVVPAVIWAQYGMTPSDFAVFMFYAQWANATFVPDRIDLSLFVDGIPSPFYGFEAGYPPYPTNISYTTAKELWNETNPLSFVNNETGLLCWLAALAESPLGGNFTLLNTTFSLGNAKMAAILTWLGYWIMAVAPTFFEAEKVITLDAAPEYMFYEQWANGTMLGEEMFPGGLDFSDFIEELVGPVIGFEVGLPPNPSNISFTSAKALWNISNPYSFINTTTGFGAWFGSWYLAGSEEAAIIVSLLNETFDLASGQIELIIKWLFNTVKENIVPPFFALPEALGGYGMTTTVYAEILLYEQWANATIQGQSVFPDGIDLPVPGGEALKGLFEVGVPTSSGISLTACYGLWDDTNPSSFINDTGLQKWRDAATKLDVWLNLSGTFGLDIPQMGLMLDWLDDIIDIFVPALFADPTLGRGMTIPAYAETLFYEQWANGTILGEDVYPQGLDLGDGLTGFEVGIPTESNISLAVCELLWNEANSSTFVNDTGIDKWLDAATSTTVQTELRTTFGLDATQMSLILNWLWENSFKDDVVPILAAEELGMSLSDYAEDLFFEQWANCTILGEKMFPEGIVLPFDNITGVEVGCPTASNISLSVAEILFDKRNSLSIVDPSGLQKWYIAADSNSNEYSELKAMFGLTDTQMGMMTTWITNFRDGVVPVLAKEEMGLPADPYTIGSWLFLGMAIGGGCLAALGVVVLLLSRRT